MEQIIELPQKKDPENNGNSSLKLTEKNFRDLVHSSPDAIFVYVDEKIIFANSTAMMLIRAEKEEEVIISRRPKKTEMKLMGRIHWYEDMEDVDTGGKTKIERSQIVKINGKWL